MIRRRLRSWLAEAQVGTARYWLTLVWLVGRVAASPPARVKLVLLGLILPARDRIVPRARRRWFRVPLSYRGLDVTFAVSSHSDLEVINELLVGEEYRLPDMSGVRTIVDLGGHIGVSVLFFRALYPDARIIAVEPDPDTFRLLAHNTAQLGGVTLLNYAASDRNGTSRFESADQGWISALGSSGEAVGVERVDTRRLATILAEAGVEEVDILKIDVEGEEERVLAAFEDRRRFRAIVGEFHGDATELPAFLDLLGAFDVDVSGGAGHYSFRARRPRAAAGAGRR